MDGRATPVQPADYRYAYASPWRHHERSWVVKNSLPAHAVPLASATEPTETSSDVRPGEEEEHAEEAFEAAILRLDGLTLELLLRRAGE